MDNLSYRRTQNQSYDKISKDILGLIEQNPDTRELRYMKVDDDTQLIYATNVLESNEIPDIDGFSFISVNRTNELEEILKKELKEESLPRQIRVIRAPNRSEYWAVFFKQ